MENDFHGTEDQLELYALGRLPDSDLPRLEEHLLACTACREKLNGTADFALAMREASALRNVRVVAPNRSWLGKWIASDGDGLRSFAVPHSRWPLLLQPFSS